jgi:hypothetical protein
VDDGAAVWMMVWLCGCVDDGAAVWMMVRLCGCCCGCVNDGSMVTCDDVDGAGAGFRAPGVLIVWMCGCVGV